MQRQSDTLIYDAMIAAVAIVNRLTVVTRNVRDFEQLGVPVLNPFAEELDAIMTSRPRSPVPRSRTLRAGGASHGTDGH